METVEEKQEKNMRGLTFRGIKVKDLAILLKHVDLLDPSNRLHIQLLQCRLQLDVARRSTGRLLLDDSPRRALAAHAHSLHLGQLDLI